MTAQTVRMAVTYLPTGATTMHDYATIGEAVRDLEDMMMDHETYRVRRVPA